MELTIYDVIKGPVMSPKAYTLNQKENQLVLVVHKDATKPLIKRALEQLFNVKVKDVRTKIDKYTKARGGARRRDANPSIKKEKVAYVRLEEGYSVNLFERAGMTSDDKAQAKGN